MKANINTIEIEVPCGWGKAGTFHVMGLVVVDIEKFLTANRMIAEDDVFATVHSFIKNSSASKLFEDGQEAVMVVLIDMLLSGDTRMVQLHTVFNKHPVFINVMSNVPKITEEFSCYLGRITPMYCVEYITIYQNAYKDARGLAEEQGRDLTEEERVLGEKKRYWENIYRKIVK